MWLRNKKKKSMYTYWLLETTWMRLWESILNFNFHQSSLNEEQSSVWRFVYGVFWRKKPQSPNPHGIGNKIKEMREKERAATTVCGGAAEFCCHWGWRRLWGSCLWIELWLWRIARDRILEIERRWLGWREREREYSTEKIKRKNVCFKVGKWIHNK